MEAGINIKDVSFRYNNSGFALETISLFIKKGSFLGITGINGSGKSTFSYLLNGLIPNTLKGVMTGKVTVDKITTDKKNVAFFAKKVGMVFQNPDFSLFNLTVSEEVSFGLKNLKFDSIPQRVTDALSSVGLAGYAKRDPQTLSVGEKQRVCLAGVLAMDTDYIVLDEPTAQLDYKNSKELYQLLTGLNKRGKTIIVIEHDTDLLWNYTKETLILNKGRIVSSGPTSKVLSDSKMLNLLGIKVPNYLNNQSV